MEFILRKQTSTSTLKTISATQPGALNLPNVSAVENLQNISTSPDSNISHTNSHSEKISKLKELKESLDSSILNQQEYDNEKAKILS